MKKFFIFLVILLLVLTGLLVFYASKYVTKTGNIIWISDPKAKGAWIRNETSNEWWSKLSNKDSKIIIVYLSPYREFSSTSLMKNDVPLVYANWKKFMKWDELRISIEWNDWEKIDNSKNNRLVSFIAQQIVKKWEIDKDKALQTTSSVINMKKSPIELIIK